MDEQEFSRQQKKERARERREILDAEHGSTYSFRLSGIEPEDAAAVERLNEICRGVGVTFELSESKFGGFTLATLRVNLKENNVRSIRTRFAGRDMKEVRFPDDDGVMHPATVEKVETLIRRDGAQKTAERLGMSKSGMYKRLKSAREAGRPAGEDEEPCSERDLSF